MLCNGKKQKSPETRSGLGLAPSRFTSLHNIRYGIRSFRIGIIPPKSPLIRIVLQDAKLHLMPGVCLMRDLQIL